MASITDDKNANGANLADGAELLLPIIAKDCTNLSIPSNGSENKRSPLSIDPLYNSTGPPGPNEQHTIQKVGMSQSKVTDIHSMNATYLHLLLCP